MQKDKTIASQIINGILKFIAVAIFIILVIPLFLSIIKGKDISPVDD